MRAPLPSLMPADTDAVAGPCSSGPTQHTSHTYTYTHIYTHNKTHSLTPADIDAVAGPFSLQQSDPKLDSSINSTFYEYIDKVCVCFE